MQSKRLVGTYANYWFLLGLLGGIQGMAYQERMAAEFQGARLRNDNDHVFEQDEYQYGARARGAAFLTLPCCVYAGIVAA